MILLMPQPANNTGDLLPNLSVIVQRCLQGAGMPAGRSQAVAGEVIAAVQDALGGERYYIPGAVRAARSDRAIEAARLQGEGLDVGQISARMGCTRNYVYQLLLAERKRVANEAVQAGKQPINPRKKK